MKVLDLYSGLGGWSEAFVERGHTVLRVDNDEQFADVPHTLIADATDPHLALSVRELLGGEPDIILASPPCESFSMQSASMHWAILRDCKCGGVITHTGKRRGGDGKDHCHSCDRPRRVKDTAKYYPVTDTARLGTLLVDRAFELVDELSPQYFWMENPRALMRKYIATRWHNLARTTVTYCQYGERRMKPTDLWGVWPRTWAPKPACKNGDPCHIAAPRGSVTGTQGMGTAAKKAVVAYGLSLEVCLACEEALA